MFKNQWLLRNHSIIFIGNSMICCDIWYKYHSWKLLYAISRAIRRVIFETILKYHKWYLCQISHTNHAIICLYYYPQKVCNFHMQVFQIKLKYHYSQPIELQKFFMQQYNWLLMLLSHYAGAFNLKLATPILDLRHVFFMDQFILFQIQFRLLFTVIMKSSLDQPTISKSENH